MSQRTIMNTINITIKLVIKLLEQIFANPNVKVTQDTRTAKGSHNVGKATCRRKGEKCKQSYSKLSNKSTTHEPRQYSGYHIITTLPDGETHYSRSHILNDTGYSEHLYAKPPTYGRSGHSALFTPRYLLITDTHPIFTILLINNWYQWSFGYPRG
uniref:Uncharacterized protein n=1 Tax=Tetranychus urticae TaxID=32264 RepID=T1K7B1_TETUR